MKNFLLFLTGLILGFLVCYFINKDSDIKDEPKMVEEPDMVVEEPVQQERMAKPSGLVTPDQMKVLSENYNERHQAVERVFGKEDNRSSWYALDDIKSYLQYADSAATAKGYELDGIRLYIGAKGDSKNKDMITLFISPTGKRMTGEGSFLFNTYQSGSGDITDIDGLDDGTGGYPPSVGYPQ
ncbi:hypothetical protein [Aegicerativicinus sediminis]|uniref:hypothetical protein n=1 Tax=Aegicerativicinus sediminis TaxID=2893202 RepID=UPI001E44913A|nr:hypothetical protein [Aegicerativicinus sediminis]